MKSPIAAPPPPPGPPLICRNAFGIRVACEKTPPAAAPAYRAHMRDSAPKTYLRDPAPTRADLAVILWLGAIFAALIIFGVVKP